MVSNRLVLSWGVLALLALASCKQKNSQPATAGQARSVLTVSATVVSSAKLDHGYSYTGTLLANEAVDLRPEISAKITGIYFKEGSTVKKGDLLVKLFNSDLQAQLKKAKLQIELAEKELSRKKELILLKGISQEEYDISENRLNTLKAEEELLKAQISKTEILAPFNGLIGLRQSSEGAFVSNATIITSLQQLSPIKVEFAVPEKFLSQLSIGTEINFTVEGRDDIFKARIYATESKIDAATRSIRIRALSDNRDLQLFPGQFANIRLNYSPDKESIAIPARAIYPVLNGDQVFIIKGGKAKPIDIKTGYRDGSLVEVLEGVTAGDTLVLSGLLQIKEGMPVKANIVQ